jgi:hypothetical protein
MKCEIGIVPNIKDGRAITLHTDGTVSYFDGSQWVRRAAVNISCYDHAFLGWADSEKILNHAKKHT